MEFNPPDDRPLQDKELVDTERRNAVQRAIGTLPEKYRAPLILRETLTAGAMRRDCQDTRNK